MSQRTPWLKTNSRPLFISMVFPTLLIVLGIVGWFLLPASGWLAVVKYLSLGGLVFGLIALAALALLLKVPRLSYEPGYLLVYTDYMAPARVPIDIVECFFLGQGPAKMPFVADDDDGPETNTLIVRLAEAKTEWHRRPCRPQLGHWCDGYIILRGTWCEPLTGELITNLNRWLVEAHRRLKQESTT